MSTKTTAKAKATKEVKETKKEFKLESIFSMWRNVSKQGKVYFSGQFDGKKIRGFYNTDKKNPKEPDFRVYALDEKGDIEKDEIVSLWCNVSKKNKRYLSGKIDGQRVIGFINEKSKENPIVPYFTLYWSDQQETKEEAKKEEFEEISTDDAKALPF